MKNNFIDFINHPDNFSSTDFLDNNKILLDKLNNIKLKKLKMIKKHIDFDEDHFNTIYKHSIKYPTIK